MMQDHVYQTPVRDVLNLSQHSIDKALDGAIDEWRKKPQACVNAKGGHFEHLL